MITKLAVWDASLYNNATLLLLLWSTKEKLTLTNFDFEYTAYALFIFFPVYFYFPGNTVHWQLKCHSVQITSWIDNIKRLEDRKQVTALWIWSFRPSCVSCFHHFTMSTCWKMMWKCSVSLHLISTVKTHGKGSQCIDLWLIVVLTNQIK